mmetsp:Transcript_56154/g.120445  ORF Transcript_56154/g.120445 Transcript_56154/m.120445 type:complete len:186 (-) Transcript_56154:318-875(-)
MLTEPQSSTESWGLDSRSCPDPGCAVRRLPSTTPRRPARTHCRLALVCTCSAADTGFRRASLCRPSCNEVADVAAATEPPGFERFCLFALAWESALLQYVDVTLPASLRLQESVLDVLASDSAVSEDSAVTVSSSSLAASSSVAMACLLVQEEQLSFVAETALAAADGRKLVPSVRQLMVSERFV